MQYSAAPPPLNTGGSQWDQSPIQRSKTRTRGKNRSRHAHRPQASPRRQGTDNNEEILGSLRHSSQASPSNFASLPSRANGVSSNSEQQHQHQHNGYSVRRHHTRGSRANGYRTSTSRRHQKEYQSSSHNNTSSQLPQIATAGMKRPPTSGNGRELVITTENHSTAAVSSIKGLKPNNPNWNNQDSFFIVESFADNNEMLLYCVLDGHGEVGHHVSSRCRSLFPDFIRRSNYDMKKAFHQMQHDLVTCDIDSRCSGATCNLALISGNVISVSNCGDSRCVLGRRMPGGGYTAIQLSNDHKPDMPEERKRVLSCGGHLGCRQAMVNQGGRGLVSVPVGPTRVWYQYRGDTLGLAMSRSLGDAIVHKCGVSAEPETIDHTIVEGDEFLILATDGIWDVVDSHQAVQVVQNFAIKSPNWDAHEAALWLSKYARNRWEKMSPMVDDITCIIVKINAPRTSQTNSSLPRSGLTETDRRSSRQFRNAL